MTPGASPWKEAIDLTLRNYELTYILDPELSDEEIETLTTRFESYLEEGNGTIIHKEEWGPRRLAYPIKNKREGRYYHMKFSMDSRNLKEFERNLLLAEGLMRELIVRLDTPVEPATREEETTPEPSSEEMS